MPSPEPSDGRPGRALSTTELLGRLCAESQGERISLGEVAEKTSGRAHGLVLLLLALPEMIPMVGLSAVIAAPIFVTGGYLMVYGDVTRLPGWFKRRSIRRALVDTAIDRTIPVIRRLDRIARPRWPALAGASRLHGTVCMLMAALLAVPIPGVNILAACAVGGIGLGMLQRDGLVVGIALVSAGLALVGAAAVFAGAGYLISEVVDPPSDG